ncbi:unnamed protein product [Nesidiocoris tenuis]|uniref:Uncharacterized protein n=1 Tax=Nesidiocoris tenuis TaxID=355587 RepID=A0A6H5GF12_9HEMI|nr:unnamed protein product [Nesidiocoris tenuis]
MRNQYNFQSRNIRRGMTATNSAIIGWIAEMIKYTPIPVMGIDLIRGLHIDPSELHMKSNSQMEEKRNRSQSTVKPNTSKTHVCLHLFNQSIDVGEVGRSRWNGRIGRGGVISGRGQVRAKFFKFGGPSKSSSGDAAQVERPVHQGSFVAVAVSALRQTGGKKASRKGSSISPMGYPKFSSKGHPSSM